MFTSRSDKIMAIVAGTLGVVLCIGALIIVGGSDEVRSRRRTLEPVAALQQGLRKLTQTTRPTFTYDATLDVGGSAAGEPNHIRVTGANDAPARLTTGTIDRSTAGGDDTLRFLLKGRRLFVHDDGSAERAWKEVDVLRALRASDDANGVGALALAVQRPVALAGLLLGVESAENLGRDTTADGLTATHYRATSSFDQALEAIRSSADAELLRAVTERIDGDEIELDAWIDTNRRLRQLRMEGTIDGGRPFSLELRFRTFSQPVEATLPDSSTVVAVADLLDAEG